MNDESRYHLLHDLRFLLTPEHECEYLPDREALTQARDIALANGVHYAYTGNVHDKDGQSTYCHACGQRLIGRDWYTLSEWNLDAEGYCTKCGTHCAGVFDAKPGTWGARRQPIAMVVEA